MQNNILIGASEIAQELNVSKAFAYKVVRSLNEELKQRGYIVIAGKVSRRFFEERFYGYKCQEVEKEVVTSEQ